MTKLQLTFLLAAATVVFAAIGVLTGTSGLGLAEIADGLNATERTILFQLRIPRVLMAVFAGTALAVSGALMQTFFRNPLAEPYVTGVSAGGALGAVALGLIGLTSPWSIALGAIAGAALVTAALYAFSLRRGTQTSAVLLMGVALGTLCGALVWFILIKMGPQQTDQAVAWLLGSVVTVGYREVWILAGAALLGLLAAYKYVPELDALLLGDEKAASLGVNLLEARRAVIGIASFLAAVCVAFCGVIAFVGLIMPHIVRNVVGARHALLLPLSALGGAALLLGVDIAARTINQPGEVPITVLTSMIGAPFFVLLLLYHREAQA